MEDKKAYCGLDCATCDAYKATITNDDVLREKTALLWSELNGVTILPEQIRCEGCKGNGVKTIFCEKLCPIRTCAVKKEMDACALCADFKTCKTIAMITQKDDSAFR